MRTRVSTTTSAARPVSSSVIMEGDTQDMVPQTGVPRGVIRVASGLVGTAAVGEVVVDQTGGLHEGVGGRRTDEPEAPLLQRPGERGRLRRHRGYVVQRARARA